jgi:F-type H+-transporting ATPase subunit b
VRPDASRRALGVALLLALALCLLPMAGSALAQAAGQEHGAGAPAAAPEHAAAPAAGHEAAAGQEHAAAGAEHGEAEHGESWLSVFWRVANFAILAGGLWYLLRKPVERYLEARADQIQKGLVDAAMMRSHASSQIQDIEARLKALPAEIDRLQARGAEEIAAEQVRIRDAAERERQRLMEQARRDIDLQLQSARRDLTTHAANLAVDLAEKKIEREITPADQQRLVDQYVARMETLHE